MRVLALDPGYDRLGVAVVERQNGKDFLLYSTCIVTERSNAFAERLYVIGTALEKLFVDFAPTAVAVETLFFNKNQKTAIGVAQTRGVIVYLAKQHKCSLFEFGPQEIKIAVTGYGKSDKKAVFDMVKRLIAGVPPQALDDEYDAIAVGITALAHNRVSPT
jgi:crossover junction endodeoxyribonuclease RuvC